MIRICADWYNLRCKVRELSDESYQILKLIFTNEDSLDKPKEEFAAYGSSEATLSSDEIEFLPNEIVKLFSFKPVKHNRFINFEKLNDKDIKENVKSVFQVHFSDNDLMMVRKVDWLENACTEELQRKLDSGYRILAVCPQPGSRRPDYVLGLLPQYIEK